MKVKSYKPKPIPKALQKYYKPRDSNSKPKYEKSRRTYEKPKPRVLKPKANAPSKGYLADYGSSKTNGDAGMYKSYLSNAKDSYGRGSSRV